MGNGDRDLLDRLRSGDEEAFQALYRQHSRRLYNLAFRMLNNGADAEDLLQEVFLQVHRKLETFRGESALSTWMYRMTINQCLDRLRSSTGRASQATEPLVGGDSPQRMEGTRDPAVIDRLDLERAIAQLPDGYRAVFLLHDVEGFEHHEIGAMLGIAVGTSKSQVHKARIRLRELLGR